MVVQTRLSSCGLSIFHVEQRPAASPQRAARVRGEPPALGNREFQSQSTFTLASTDLQVWRRRPSPEAHCQSLQSYRSLFRII
jgi:hypothetical protein